MDILPSFGLESSPGDFQQRFAQVDQVDGIKIGDWEVFVPRVSALSYTLASSHFLNIPSRSSTNIDPYLRLCRSSRREQRLSSKVTRQKLQHRLSTLQQVTPRRIVHIRLILVEPIQSFLLVVCVMRGFGEWFEKAIPDEAHGCPSKWQEENEEDGGREEEQPSRL